MKREGFTIVVETPKTRLRWARPTNARPGKEKDNRRGGGKWRPRNGD
jgi:hypothetical protein